MEIQEFFFPNTGHGLITFRFVIDCCISAKSNISLLYSICLFVDVTIIIHLLVFVNGTHYINLIRSVFSCEENCFINLVQ